MEPTPKPEQFDPEPPVTVGVAEAAEHELSYEETLAQLTDRLDGLADDETAIWTPDAKNPDTQRTIHMSVASANRGEGTDATVRLIDEPGRPRWYVMDIRDNVLVRRPKQSVVQTQHEVLYWSKGREQALANGTVNQDGVGKVRVTASLDQLRLAQKVTDPENCQVPRKVAMDQEEVAALSRTGRFAHYAGRLLGKKNVKRF